jgi:ABC-2 type transport system permease protein
MKKISYIARNELYTLFYSPIAWILMIVFLVMTSAGYFNVLSSRLELFQRGGETLMYTNYLTDAIVSNPYDGYFPGVIKNLYIMLPLITMGLISREVSSGTIKLLYSSPVRVREVVLGKFLAIVYFILCLLVLLFITLVALAMSLTHPDYGQIAGSVVGLFLVLLTYAAIGLFISSLTSYQIVAALITLAIFAILANIGEMGQDIHFIRAVTYYMNLGGKSGNFMAGFMNLRDFLYFVMLIVSFLLFTIIRIHSATESISSFHKAMRYVTVILVVGVIGYITSQPRVNFYYDSTEDKIHTITPHTQEMLAKLNGGELEITVFENLLNMYYTSYFKPSMENRITTQVWEPYIRFKPDIKISFIPYYNQDTVSSYFKTNPGKSIKEIADKEAKASNLNVDLFLPPDEVNRLVNTKAEKYRPFFQLKYKGRTAIVRVFDDNEFWPSENEIAAAINRLIATPPKITFLSDEIERGPFSQRPRDYNIMATLVSYRYALINQGYDFDTLSLEQQDIPSNLAGIAIADPRTPFSTGNLEKINRYIDSGGNVFLASEPDRKMISKPLFDKLGLSLRDGLLIQPNPKYSSDCLFPYLTDTAENFSPQFKRTLIDETRYYGDTLFRVAMQGSNGIDFSEKDGFRIDPLLYSDKFLSWNRLAPVSEDSLFRDVARRPDDEHGNFITAVRMTRLVRGKQQRILVTSDADFISGPQLFSQELPFRYNDLFSFWCFSSFSYGEFPANTMRPITRDRSFRITANQLPFFKFILYWIIPALIAIMASIILIRRKRK